MKSNLLNRKLFPRTAAYSKNGIVHLIILLTTCYILFHAVKVILIVLSDFPQNIVPIMRPYIALGNGVEWLSKPWTIISFFLVEAKLFTLLTNMLWLYLFGSALQSLVGYKEIIPLFFISNIMGGIIFTLIRTFLPTLPSELYLQGATLGILAIGIATLLIAPTYRYYMSENFSFPLWVGFLIFLLLNVFFQHNHLSYYLLIVVVGLVAWVYTWMLKRGKRWGNSLYGFIQKINQSFDKDYQQPSVYDTTKISSLQHSDKALKELQINTLLDKIHQKGMSSLTKEEHELLEKLSQEL